jgi:hypothetical protein
LGRLWTINVGKKGATMGEGELCGDAQPKAVVGTDVRLEVAGEEQPARRGWPALKVHLGS